MVSHRARAGGALLVIVCACGVAFDSADTGGAGSGTGGDGGEGGDGAPSTATGATGGAPEMGGEAGAPSTTGMGGNTTGGRGGGGGAVPLTCPSPNTVCCGSEPCPLPAMECCAASQSETQQSVCVPAGTCPTAQLPIRCDDSEDCGSEICCATWNGSQHRVIECSATCTPPVSLGSAGTYPMCNFPSGSCPSGLSCFDDCCVGDLGMGYCF